jgi:hypothetical protein
MAPMTRQMSPGGIPGPEVAAYYRRRAESGTGLIITEGTAVDDPVSTMSVDIPNFYGPALDGWLRVVDAVHEVGGKIMPQLWHVGVARNPAKAPHPELPSAGPSGLTMRGFPGLTQPGLQHSEPMTRAHIRRVVEAFGQAAADAQRLGLDGVEIHGAHGYLIDQFFWAGTISAPTNMAATWSAAPASQSRSSRRCAARPGRIFRSSCASRNGSSRITRRGSRRPRRSSPVSWRRYRPPASISSTAPSVASGSRNSRAPT